MLNYFILGTGASYTFDINDKKNKDVVTFSHFKDAIKEKIENAKLDGLKLWKVCIDTRNNRDKYLELKKSSADTDIKTNFKGKELEPSWEIAESFRTIPKEHIHIIVQSPPPSATTDVSRDLGYLPRQGGLGGTLLPFDMKVGSTNEGVNLSGRDRELISLRFDIIKSLINELKCKKVILVQAPPFSGKTSTAQILEEALVNAPEYSNHRVIRISLLWESHINWDTFGKKWKSIVGISWEEWTKQCRKIPSILIVDEAHLIYGKDKKVSNKESADKESADQFWATVKSLLQEVSSIKIIMFAAYGYRSSNYAGLATPVKLPETNCKSLIDINFSQGELKNYVKNYCSKCFKILNQQEVLELYEYIRKVTEGHAGLVRHILGSIENALKNKIDELNWKIIFKYLNSKEFDLSIYNNCRAVPNVKSLNRKQLELCEETYLKGKTPFSDDEDAVYLVKTGVLMVVEDNGYLTFAAPLLKRAFFQQNYGVSSSSNIIPTDLYQFIVKVFTAMCNKLSGNILRETLGFGSEGRILEQTWQKEFYRIGTQVLGRNHFLSPEVGSVFGCEGKIDFYVDKLDWAIELLRDGEDMKGHKDRFEPGGKYKEIVKYAKSIAIIDIRSIGRVDTRNEAKKVREMKADFIYVSCSKNFDEFKIESLGKEILFIRSQD
ncbi:unnamed protein product [Rhizophagus irregularis]|nr:unnamed protein product [Rhizophagus irregularis]